jgi:mercuric ion binding protein
MGNDGMKKRILLLLALVLIAPRLWAENQKVTIDIKAMTCSLCVISINKALRSTDGVIKAKASLKTHQAEVIVPEGFDNQVLLAAISRTGYTGEIQGVVPAP